MVDLRRAVRIRYTDGHHNGVIYHDAWDESLDANSIQSAVSWFRRHHHEGYVTSITLVKIGITPCKLEWDTVVKELPIPK